MRVGVVIPSWNSLLYLRGCIESLRKQTYSEMDLIVVDNGSSDGSIDWLRHEDIPHVAIHRNAGFAVAVNLGAAQLKCDRVLVLNADAVLEPTCITLLMHAMDTDSSLGGVQPRIMQLDEGSSSGDLPSRVYSTGQALTRDGRAFELGAGDVFGIEHETPRETFGVCGAACLLRRELFTELGGYEEAFFAFYEDVELNVKARVAGWRFELVPDAVVWHVGNAIWKEGFTKPAAENARLVARNRLLTQMEFVSPAVAPRIMMAEIGSLARAAKERRLRATVTGKMQALLAWRGAMSRRRRHVASGDLSAARAWLGKR